MGLMDGWANPGGIRRESVKKDSGALEHLHMLLLHISSSVPSASSKTGRSNDSSGGESVDVNKGLPPICCLRAAAFMDGPRDKC